MKKNIKKFIPINDEPFLTSIEINFDKDLNKEIYPFSLPLVQNLNSINFTNQVTFFVGENGAGKSTILESIAEKIGFGPEGGSKNISFKTSSVENNKLAECMNLSWTYKPHNGYFFRAETFFNISSYLENIGDNFESYGGKSLHLQSHGEGFLSFFNNRLGDGGFFILDEPEAALSPIRQLSLLKIIHDLVKDRRAQFIIATHSPIILAYPDAEIYSCDEDNLKKIEYRETSHYQITKRFLSDTDLFLKNLFMD